MKKHLPFVAILAFLFLLAGISQQLPAAGNVINRPLSEQPSIPSQSSKEYVKVFFYIHDEDEKKNTELLETKINLWLSQEGEKIQVVRVCQSQSGYWGQNGNHETMITISIFYRRL